VDVVLRILRKNGALQVQVLVEDDGCGFDVDAVLSGPVEGRFGLLSMQERVRILGGELLVDSIVGEGTALLVSVPPTVDGESEETAAGAA
jgi:two-component system sensor histidine kinase DegS